MELKLSVDLIKHYRNFFKVLSEEEYKKNDIKKKILKLTDDKHTFYLFLNKTNERKILIYKLLNNSESIEGKTIYLKTNTFKNIEFVEIEKIE
ncbi:MAG: hypothetical protein QW474_02240 [Candidatus Aenigmatarchaeota archaeon]